MATKKKTTKTEQAAPAIETVETSPLANIEEQEAAIDAAVDALIETVEAEEAGISDTHLTPREAEMLERIIGSEYHDSDEVIDHQVWSVCLNKSDNAVMGSLIKKGLAGSQTDEDGTTCWITQEGYDAAALAKADEQLAEIATIVEAKQAEEQEVNDIVKQQCKEAKVAERKAARPTSAKYEAACAEVSRTNKAFIEALDEKAAALGTVRVGEAVGVYAHPDMYRLNEDIRRARGELEALLERKRNLKVSVEGLEAINEKVSRFRKERDTARWMKKVAASELETA